MIKFNPNMYTSLEFLIVEMKRKYHQTQVLTDRLNLNLGYFIILQIWQGRVSC